MSLFSSLIKQTNALKLLSKYYKNSFNASMTWTKRLYGNQSIKSTVLLQQLDMCCDPPSRALILGVYTDSTVRVDTGVLTKTAFKFNVEKTNNRLIFLIRSSGPMPQRGQARLFFAVEPEPVPYYSCVAVIGLGEECLGYNSYEILDEEKEAIRKGVGAACRKLQELCVDRIEVESCGHAESAAEGAALGVWCYQELRHPDKRLDIPTLDLYTPKGVPCDWEGWRMGLQKAGAQNLTRQFQEMPANLLTPTAFAQNVVDVLCKSGVNVEVKVEGWAASQKMNAFLSVARASCESAIFLELSYYGTSKKERPVVLVGQGITYDCGGIMKKEFKYLRNLRCDMTGAAVVVAAIRAISGMRLPINIRGLVPLCENVMGCNGFKPGDVVQTMGGKHIEIEGTNQEGVLVLADALLYAQNFCPKYILDIGTTSRTCLNIMDAAASLVFTNSELLWQKMRNASMHTGDRVWRFPLWDYYKANVTSKTSADVQNYGVGSGAKACKAAAFLKQFVPCGQWMHIDCSNTVISNGTDFPYLRKGMAGRPTRTVVEFLAQSICSNVHPKV